MPSAGDWPPTLVPDRGRRGTILSLSLHAPGIGDATHVSLGADVLVRRAPHSASGRLDLLLTIAADAVPGWRDLEVVRGGSPQHLPRAFEILEQIPYRYGSGRPGIGSHLI